MDTWQRTMVAAAIVVFGFGWYVVARLHERSRRRVRLQNRRCLTLQEAAELFAEAHGLPVSLTRDVLVELGEVLHVCPGKLRPYDHLYDLRGQQIGPTSDMEDLEMWLAARTAGADCVPGSVDTIGDVVSCAFTCGRKK